MIHPALQINKEVADIEIKGFGEFMEKQCQKSHLPNSGFDPGTAYYGMVMAGYHIEAGAYKFDDYAKKMIEGLGSNIKPYLKACYSAVKHSPGMNSTGMSTEEEIDAIDIDSIVVEPKIMKSLKRKSEKQQIADPNTLPKWFNSPVTIHKGKLGEMRTHLPVFERRSFGITQPGNKQTRLNERFDTIVRLPFGDDQNLIPVGVVSKEYTLVPHMEVLDTVLKALQDANISSTELETNLEITEYGERMALSIFLPEQYIFDPGDGHPMALRIECFNSVDGSTRFRALMGWFRFVCSNGLVIGVTQSDVRRRHVGDIQLKDIGTVLKTGLEESEIEKKNFEQWRKTKIMPDLLSSWVDNTLKDRWGFKAAARTYHIAQTGFDGKIIGQYQDNTPTRIKMMKTVHVPGSPSRCENLFDLSHILAWLAHKRRDVQEQLNWREKIPQLLKPLMKKNGSA